MNFKSKLQLDGYNYIYGMENWCKNRFCQNQAAIQYFGCSNGFTTKFYNRKMGDPQIFFWCPYDFLVAMGDWATTCISLFPCIHAISSHCQSVSLVQNFCEFFFGTVFQG